MASVAERALSVGALRGTPPARRPNCEANPTLQVFSASFTRFGNSGFAGHRISLRRRTGCTPKFVRLSVRNENEVDVKEDGSVLKDPSSDSEIDPAMKSSLTDEFGKEISKVVKKTAGTFAPRASAPKSKNPAVPGTTLYVVFEVQAYVSMVLGGILSFNLLFPSDEPDIWRLMGMWSIWMFTIPSLRARDCSNKEKEALNYLFLIVPLINVLLPLVWRSFAAVWTADIIAFFAMYAFKLEWFKDTGKSDA